MGKTAAREITQGNLSSLDEGDPMIPGMVNEIHLTDNMDNDCHANMKRDTAIMVEIGPENQQNLNEKIEVNAIIDGKLLCTPRVP